MIFPYLLGLKDFAQAPLTWTLVFLNLAFYFLTLDASRVSTENSMMDVRRLQQTGVFYRQYRGHAELPSSSELILWGGQALRDPDFLKHFEEFPFRGDAQELKVWSENFRLYRDSGRDRPVRIFGFARDPDEAWSRPLTWVTYQFMHAGAFHLLSNMMFLLLFGIAIERRSGSLPVVFIFLLGGVFGALFALWSDPPSALPMVGASASVSALIGYYLVSEDKKNVRYFYFFSPFRNFYGEIFLSKWWIVAICLLPDLASWLTGKFPGPSQLLSETVATTAHLGGALFGFVVAWSFKNRPVFRKAASSSPHSG